MNEYLFTEKLSLLVRLKLFFYFKILKREKAHIKTKDYYGIFLRDEQKTTTITLPGINESDVVLSHDNKITVNYKGE